MLLAPLPPLLLQIKFTLPQLLLDLLISSLQHQQPQQLNTSLVHNTNKGIWDLQMVPVLLVLQQLLHQLLFKPAQLKAQSLQLL